MLRNLARKGLDVADDLCLALDRFSPDGGGALVPVLFHALYPDRAALADESLAPTQDVTVAVFRDFVHAMLEAGYAAVSPAQVDAGLAPGGRYFMVTFDDGYFNNTLALPVLQEFRVPGTFFISTDHVRQGKAFWWDAFSRKLAAQGITGARQRQEVELAKRGPPRAIEDMLRQRFGERVLDPCGDLDRPFSPAELREFAASPWVHLGNHTCDHAILTRCEPGAIAAQVQGCQRALADLAGIEPIAIAYPNGDHSPAAVQAAMAAGLRLGFTVVPARSPLPIADPVQRMTIGRFLFHGSRDLQRQCRAFGARVVPSHVLRRLSGARTGQRPAATHVPN